MAIPISVVIPVGPKPHHVRWLDEAVDSVFPQMVDEDEFVIVDNGAGIGTKFKLYPMANVWGSPCPLGVPISFNAGVGLAKNEHVLMMGSDDKLLAGCLDACREAIEKYRDPLGWYVLGVEYSDGKTQNTPCNASVVTKELWNLTGGFPPESAVGACDRVLISMLTHNRGKAWTGDFYEVSNKMFYWHRLHPDQDTRRLQSSWGPISKAVRGVFTVEWKP